MSGDHESPSRRRFLAGLAGGAAAAAAAVSVSPSVVTRVRAAEPPAPAARGGTDDVCFFLVSDTHYLADKADPGRLDPRSAEVTSRLVDTLNRLPGTPIPAAAGGGVVGTPRGVIHGGDIIDSGDKSGGPHPAMQATEWAAYAADFGLAGGDGRLKFPVYDVHGNHDAPGGRGLVIDRLVERNRRRPGVAGVSPNGVHYAWDWGPVHFACLGIVVGSDASVARRRRYDPLGSLTFLVEDLRTRVGDSGRPVVLVHHVDVARYSTPPDPQAPYANQEWDPCDVRAFHDAIRPFNVAAILYGHTHVRNVFRWDGRPPARANAAAAAAASRPASARAPGVRVFNTDNASHFNSETQALLYFELKAGRVTVREYATKDRWTTGAWTPQTWA